VILITVNLLGEAKTRPQPGPNHVAKLHN